MNNKSLKIPAIILVAGLVLAIVACMLTGMVKEPTIAEHDFAFTVNYLLDGDAKTLEGGYKSKFTGTGVGTAPLYRYYEGEYLMNPSENHPSAYTVAEKDGLELCIVLCFSDRYLMNDAEKGDFNYDPYLAIYDENCAEYSLEEMPDAFDAEIVDWVFPEPVNNSFKFVGFSHLYEVSMFVMLVVGVLVIAASLIFVKRDKTVPYKALDKASIVLNCIIGVAAIPFITLDTWLMQIYVGGEELVYQLDLCIPALIAFTIAASICLRRRGFTKIGFFVQFVGPVLYAVLTALESVL